MSFNSPQESVTVALPVTFVAADRTGQAAGGIGTALLAGLMHWASTAGITRLWVASGGRAIDFSGRCGFTHPEVVTLANGDRLTILRARLHPPSAADPTG